MPLPSLMASMVSIANAGAGFTVDLPAGTQSASKTSTSPITASAGWRFNRDATVDRLQSSWAFLHQWGTPSGGTDGDDYEVRFTKNSGTTPSGSSLNTWLALSATRSVTLSRSSIGSSTCNLTVEIRDVATQTVQDSGTYTITATQDPDF